MKTAFIAIGNIILKNYKSGKQSRALFLSNLAVFVIWKQIYVSVWHHLEPVQQPFLKNNPLPFNIAAHQEGSTTAYVFPPIPKDMLLSAPGLRDTATYIAATIPLITKQLICTPATGSPHLITGHLAAVQSYNRPLLKDTYDPVLKLQPLQRQYGHLSIWPTRMLQQALHLSLSFRALLGPHPNQRSHTYPLKISGSHVKEGHSFLGHMAASQKWPPFSVG